MEKEKYIMQSVLELRPNRKQFKFLDKKGEILDSLINNYGWDKINIQDKKIEMADKEIQKSLYVAWDAIAFQIEIVRNIDKISYDYGRFINTIRDGKYCYDINDFSRIGARNIIFFHKNGQNFEDLRDRYSKLFNAKSKVFTKDIISNIDDLGYAFDMKKDGKFIKVKTGPMKKEEYLQKYIPMGLRELYEKHMNFSGSAGIFLDIDISERDISGINTTDLVSKVDDCVNLSKEIFNNFTEEFFKEN